MKTQMMIAILVVAVVAASVAVAAAPRVRMGQPGTPGMDGRMDWSMRLDKLTKELNLTPDQVAQLKQIHQDFLSSTQSARDDLKAKRQQMIALWTVDQPDPVAIKALADDMAKDKAEVRDAAIDHMITGLTVLTTDQRAKLRTIIQKWTQKRHGKGVCPMSD